MATAEVAIAIDEQLLHDVDLWVASGEYPDRNVAVQVALTSLRAQRGKRRRMLRELTKLNQAEERQLADEHLASEVQWPPY
jgi:Arc/MetJ-type ribon-helix-helix transcriptional regulator